MHTLKKIIACLVVALATFGVWYGAKRFMGAQVFAEAENEAQAQEAPGVYIEPAVPEQPVPGANDIAGRIAYGDFSVLTGEDAETIAALTAVHEETKGRSRFAEADVTGDRTKELLWMMARDDMRTETVIGVFTPAGDTYRLIAWDPETDEDFFLAGRNALCYIRKNVWTVSEFHCMEVLFDRSFEMYGGDGLVMYLVQDGDAYRDGVDAAMRRRLSDIDGKGVWYYALKTGQSQEESEKTTSGEWLNRFERMAGSPLMDVAPDIETVRTGTERGLARNMFLVRRSRYGAPAYEEAVYYPQLTQGERAGAINNLLRKGAFSELLGDAEGRKAADNPDAYFGKIVDDDSVSRTSVMNYGVITDTDALISVVFNTRRTEAETETDQLSFLTIDKQLGRELQLGDLTTVDGILDAIQRGRAELFYVDTAAFTYTRDREKTHDAAFLRDAFDRTRKATDRWKQVGLDEQFLFLAIIVDEETGTEAVLRIPRWECGMTSAGHMELLMRHPLYPYLRGTLDMADSLVVRRHPDGFYTDYATGDGGRIRLDIHEPDLTLPSDMSPEGERDFFAAQYDHMTAYSAGTLTVPDAPAVSCYALEQSYGEAGCAVFDLDGRVFMARATGTNTREMPLLGGSGKNGGAVFEEYASLRDDGVHDAVWHNYRDGGMRLTHEISDGIWFDFTLHPAEDEDAGYRGITISMRESGESVTYETGTLPREYTFRDLNDDGYDDLTFGVINESDHTKERNFIFLEQLRTYVSGPAELEGTQPYRFDPDTGYVIVGDESSEATLYGFDAEGAFLPLRTFVTQTSGGDTRFVIRAAQTEETAEGEEAPLVEETVPQEEALSRRQIVQSLFTPVFLWERALIEETEEAAEAPPDGEEAEERSLRVIVTRRRASDIIDPYDQYRIFLVEEGGAVLGMMETERLNGLLRDITAENTSYDGTLLPESAILFHYGEEEETLRVEMKELLEAGGDTR